MEEGGRDVPSPVNKPKIAFGLSSSSRRPIIKPAISPVNALESKTDTKSQEVLEDKKTEPLVIPLKTSPLPEVPLNEIPVEDTPPVIPSFAVVVEKYDPTVTGLQIIKKTTTNEPSPPPKQSILLRRRQIPGLADIKDPKKRLEYDLAHRPDGGEKTVPIHEFGAAMLRGMGWKGEVAKRDDSDADLGKLDLKRPKTLGLGADPKLIEEREASHELDVKINPSEGLFAGFVSAKEAHLLPQPPAAKKLAIGDTVIILVGEHAGLKGVLQSKPNPNVQVKLLISGEAVTLEPSQIGTSETVSVSDDPQPTPSHGPSWIKLGMRVRIIGKQFLDGKYYWKRATIVDLHIDEDGITRFTANIPNFGLVERLHEGILQPIHPSQGTLALPIIKSLPQEVGRVIDAKPPSCHWQLLDSLQVITCNLEDLCEYEG